MANNPKSEPGTAAPEHAEIDSHSQRPTMTGMSRNVPPPDQTSPDQTSPDQTSPDEVSPDKAAPVLGSPDEVAPDEVAPDEVASGGVKPILKGLIMLASMALVVFVIRHLGLEDMLQGTDWFDQHVRGKGLVGILTYVGVGAMFTAMGMPRQIICFLGGYAFGFFFGLVYGTVASGLGCAMAVAFARFLGRDFVVRRFGARLAPVDAFLSKSPFNMALTIRFFPLGSNLLTNLAAGVSSIPAWPFIIGSTIGYLPQTTVFALFGSGVEVSSMWRMVMGVVLFVISTLMGLHIWRRYRREK